MLQTQTSLTQCVYSIIAALVKAEDMEGMGANRVWTTRNDTQEQFLNRFFASCRSQIAGIPEIESIASWKVEDINCFLVDHGFSIQLSPLSPDTFGVASVLDLMVEWYTRGDRTTVTINDRHEYPGVRIGGNNVMFYTSPGHNHPIAGLLTKSEDVVYMTMLDNPPTGDFDLLELARQFNRDWRHTYDFDGLVFPMVSLDQQTDISWLLNMRTFGDDGRGAVITQAFQQNKLRMNDLGARAQSAVAIAVTREAFHMPKPDHVINQPFMVWFKRPSLDVPLFVGYIMPDNWSDPGDINIS